jgi:phage major head subunit gpT-like protein
MLITSETLHALFTAYNAEYKTGFNAVTPRYLEIASKTKSVTSESIYPWLGQFPMLREWLGDRHIKSMEIHDFTIKNRKFESTVSVPRDKIEDDHYGTFAPVFQQMGRMTAAHPDTLIFPLLKAGFTESCYDGQYFFDANHPSKDENDNEVIVSNRQDGSGEPWFLIDGTQPFKPLVWQERLPYEFQQITDPKNAHVIMRDEYIYGVRGRANAGFGLWQLAYGSKAPLTMDNYALARETMQKLRGDRGQLLGITPTLLVCGPANEKAARSVLKSQLVLESGATAPIPNVWVDTADLLITPYL